MPRQSRATQKFKEAAESKSQEYTPDWSKGLSSGIRLLNLACSGKSSVAFLPGLYYLFVGDSAAGKSWLLLQTLAEASMNLNYNDYRFIHDNPERGTLMNFKKYFGKAMSERLEAPSPSGSSALLEEFYDNVQDAANSGKPFIYGLDSEDALDDEASLIKAKEDKKRRQKGSTHTENEDGEVKKPKGSYKLSKPKLNSGMLKVAFNSLRDTNSLLFIIKQTRDNIGPDAMFKPKTRSGGNALTFYATQELWFSIKGKIRDTRLGKPRVLGTTLKIHVKKNRESGKDRIIEVPFYPDHGFDDTGASVNWMIDEDRWEVRKGKVIVPEFEFEGKTEKFIQWIEENNKEKELGAMVTEAWIEVEEACKVQRKRRYQCT
jgi:hypothetical protein